MAAEILIGIVDDDLSLRRSLIRLVRSMGYEARGFASAEEFIEADSFERYSCIITDIQMPGISGIELTKFIAASHTKIPVMVVTARSEAALEQAAIASGAMCFLRKPIDTDVLVATLMRALGV
ncbi:response regulator [Rhizobium laguerreae]|uniref:response regulator transcription factor n=1 Tax=Rhizobium TaxID=379 RepID=UPI001C91967A|nr:MULTISPECIES: response regulator [Rhizobium]MBY3537558.1 response regulator [Rhizobium laguerreae]MBY5705752.1 response regulator [Rhizobium leguminosarum]